MASKTRTKKAARKVAVKPKLSKAELLDKKIEREIAKREAVFKKASPAKKRVLIAKDVIAQIKAKKVKPETGAFVRVDKVQGVSTHGLYPTPYSYVVDTLIDTYGNAADARDLYLSNRIQRCSCCALGSMFVSCTLYNDNTTVGDLEFSNSEIGEVLERAKYAKALPNGLDTFFSVSQLRLIEQTFEGDRGVVMSVDEDCNGEKYPKYSARSRAFHDKYKKPKDRLIAIMRNIIRNNGTFKP